MAAISKQLVARDIAVALLKREDENWAKQEVGLVVVFCILFIVAIILLSIFIHKKLAARKLAKGGQ